MESQASSDTTIEPEDLPQTWQRPKYEELASTLRSLELSPPVWSPHRRENDVARLQQQQQESFSAQHKAAVTRYLSSIIKSPLAWIDDEDQKEEIWDLASKRMSERCGRTAMGEVTRSWHFPGDGAASEPFELMIREPALTGDSLGLKTWGSSYVLSQHLPHLAATSLFRLFDETLGQPVPTVLELGSGTGLLGIAAAALWRTSVSLSDLPTIVPNLKHNLEQNRKLVESRGGSVEAGALTWGGQGPDEVDPELFGNMHHRFKVVLAADPMYDDAHPRLLASAIGQNLALGSEARALVMVPRRDETTNRLLELFKQAVLDLELPLFLQLEEELAGQDDWIENEESGRVRCWLGIFSRGTSPVAIV